MEPQVEFFQGSEHGLSFDVSTFPTQGLTWKMALVSQSMNKRFVADLDAQSTATVKRFVWPGGLKTDAVTGALVKDDQHKNGTAWMPIGTYNIEVYTVATVNNAEVRSNHGVAKGVLKVSSSNFVTINTEE